jgi:thiamine pyrophosphokinase
MSSPAITHWSLPFLQPCVNKDNDAPRSRSALIILNQPFSKPLLRRLWNASDWHCCADGGANRLHDLLLSGRDDNAATATTNTTTTTTVTPATAAATTPVDWPMWGWITGLVDWLIHPRRSTTTTGTDDYLPGLIKGDLDSVREDVRRYYETRVSW